MPSFDSINQLALAPEVHCRMRELERHKSDGTLSASERQELDLIAEAEKALNAIRAKARTLDNSAPAAQRPPVQTSRNGLPVVLVPPGTPAIDPAAVRRFLEEQAF